jgi:hypothetical protein
LLSRVENQRKYLSALKTLAIWIFCHVPALRLPLPDWVEVKVVTGTPVMYGKPQAASGFPTGGLDTVRTQLATVFKSQPLGLAAALAELETCEKYPAYLLGILEVPEYQSIDRPRALLSWAIRRGEMWSVFDLGNGLSTNHWKCEHE